MDSESPRIEPEWNAPRRPRRPPRGGGGAMTSPLSDDRSLCLGLESLPSSTPPAAAAVAVVVLLLDIC